MLSEPKRRPLFHYLSLPLVVAMVLLSFARLAALHRAEVIAELADRVAHSGTGEATFAVRQLARIPEPPVSILVMAAASPNPEVALEAQIAIARLLRFYQREIAAERHVDSVAQQLTTLAESLARERWSFSPNHYVWVGDTTQRVVRLANQLSPRMSPLVADHCESVLALVATHEVATPTLASVVPWDDDDVLADQEELSVMTVVEPETTQSRLEREFAALAARPWVDGRQELGVEGREPDGESVAPVRPVLEAQLPVWRPQWMHPIFHASPATPIAAPAAPAAPADEGFSTEGATTPADAPQFETTRRPPVTPLMATSNPLADVDARELLRRWLVAEGGAVRPLEDLLTERGFGRLTARMVEQFFSERVEDRLRLIDDVLTAPGAGARPWLLLLADDPDADVRLVVVTIMATSHDPLLIEKAWQVSISDRDPRIADMAGRLRERRSGTARR